MKKVFLLASFLFTAATILQAQIILKASDYSQSLPGTIDSMRDAIPTSLSLPIQSGANVTWNFTGLSYLPAWDTIHYYSPTIGLPGLQYATDQLDSISYSYHFNARMQQGVASNGLLTFGIHIDSVIYGMGGSTGNNSDSIKLYQQAVVFNAPQNELALPTSYPQNWQSSSRGLIKGEVTCNVLHYNKAPYTLVTNRFLQDSVIGWGKLQLKDEHGIASAPMDVLQVRSYVTRVDSGFINGTYIDHFEGLLMDVPQVIVSSICQEKFYRIGEVTPLVTITYVNTLHNQIKEVRVHQRRLNKLGIDRLPLQSKLFVSPNPVTGSHFLVSGIDDLQSGAYSYQIINMTGQLATAGQLKSGTINLPATINSGTFYIQVARNKEVVAIKPITVVR